jgi:hypothetical protein
VTGLETVPILRYILYVRIFKNTWFNRFADREGITDGELIEAANRLEAGQARQQVDDVNLGG